MAVTRCRFAGGSDYAAVTEFLAGLYQPENRDGNWLWPIWEYAYTHPLFDETATDRILWSQGRLLFREQYEVADDRDLFAEETLALDDIARGAAQTLVASIVEGF